MMGEKFKVYFTGELRPGTDVESCITDFSERFHLDRTKAEGLIHGGRAVVLKKGLDAAAADTYKKVLERFGMEVRIEPMQPQPATTGLALEPKPEPPPPPPGQPRQEASAAVCPKCGSPHIDEANDTCLDCGVILSKVRRIAAEQARQESRDDPYAAPRADLVGEAEAGEMTGPSRRPIGNGWGWLKDGFGYFRQNPLAWILTIVVWFALVIGINFIPLLGGLAVNLLSPAIMAGFLLGCRDQEAGGDFQVSHLFAGFSNNFGQLVLLGVMLLVFSLLLVAVMAFSIGGAFLAMGGMEAMQSENPELMMQSMPDVSAIILMILIVLGLSVPMMMAYYFAPALVAIEGLSAFSAMKHSFMGCLKNILPFLWYGILAMVLLWIGVLPFGLGLLVVLPVLMASIYGAYRDIYYS